METFCKRVSIVVALLTAGVALAIFVPPVGFWIGLAFLLVPTIAIAKPLPQLYLGDWIFSASIALFVGFPTVFGAINVLSLANLRATDPDGAEAAGNRQDGIHCLSASDGSHGMFLSDVKAQTRDPDSFEHIETQVSPNSDGHHTISMTYRARNGAGDYGVGIAIGSYSNATCQHTVTYNGLQT